MKTVFFGETHLCTIFFETNMHMDFWRISVNCELDIIVGQRVEMSNKQVDYNCKHGSDLFKD
jgi:hypothetical protein